jgi:hypothetical protein
MWNKRPGARVEIPAENARFGALKLAEQQAGSVPECRRTAALILSKRESESDYN